jgi:hypothetical protein
LTLLRAGFCLPPVLPRARCALTAPFHPYLERRYVFCATNPSGHPARALPGSLPCGVRTFLPLRHFTVPGRLAALRRDGYRGRRSSGCQFSAIHRLLRSEASLLKRSFARLSRLSLSGPPLQGQRSRPALRRLRPPDLHTALAITAGVCSERGVRQ